MYCSNLNSIPCDRIKTNVSESPRNKITAYYSLMYNLPVQIASGITVLAGNQKETKCIVVSYKLSDVDQKRDCKLSAAL